MVLFFRDIVEGMWRRKKEILLIVTVEFFAVLFVMAALLFQHNATNYTFESNRYVYGDWTIAEVVTDEARQSQQLKNHPYFGGYGTAVSGLALTDGNGKEYSYSIGWVDEILRKVGHITLREGRFPENENEIVMETSVLTELGCSFELGQQISLFLQEDVLGNGRTETFELVGILKGSLSFWNVGSYMPGVLVTKEVLDTTWFRPEITYCYYLEEQYAGADTAELYNNLSELHFEAKRTGWQMFYNNNLYAASFWNGTELYKSVEKMVLAVGMAAMSFLLAAYIQKRKKYYYHLRIIGMSKLRVKLVTLWEILWACVPGVLLGIPVGLLLGAGVCGALTVAKKLEWFYEVPLSLVGKAFVMWLLIFAVSAIIAMLITGNRRLYSSSQAFSIRFLPRWSLNKLRYNRKYSGVFIREHRVFRFRNLMGNAVGILFAVLLMLCGAQLWDSYESYRANRERYPDFRYYRNSEEYKEAGQYVWEKYDCITKQPYTYGNLWLSEGFSEGFFTLLEDIPGVVSYTYGIKDNAHLFEWENMQEDPYITKMQNEERGTYTITDEAGNRITCNDYMYEVLPENSLYFGYNSWFTTEEKTIYDLYYEAWGNDRMDFEAFDAGEQIFLISNEPGLLIEAGDVLWIEAGEGKIEVQVAAVIPQEEVTEKYYPTEAATLAMQAALTNSDVITRPGKKEKINKSIYLVGTEQLAQRIAEAEGTEVCYNWIDLQLNPLANYNLTIKQCTWLLASEGASGSSYYELLQQELGEWLNGTILYGMFFVMLTAFFFILRTNIIQSGFTFQGDRMKRLRMLGMEKRQLRNMNLLQGFYEARWVWLAVPLVYGVKIYQYWKQLAAEEAGSWFMYLEETGDMSSDPGEILRYRWDDLVELRVCLVVLIFVMLLHVLTRYLVSRSAIAALDADGRNE